MGPTAAVASPYPSRLSMPSWQWAMAMGNSTGQWAMGSNTIKAIIDQKRNKTHTHPHTHTLTITETETEKKKRN